MFSMKPKHLIPILLCLCLLLAAPAAADSTDNQTTSISEKPAIKIQYYDHSAGIAQILASGKTSAQKLTEMTELIGYDDKLHAWMHSHVDSETGERIYEKGIIESVLSFFGIWDEPYQTDAEAEAAQAQYYANLVLNYKPTGAFGAPVA